jgi:hypothetical protein
MVYRSRFFKHTRARIKNIINNNNGYSNKTKKDATFIDKNVKDIQRNM